MIREYIVKISDEVMENEVADELQELVRCKDCRWWDKKKTVRIMDIVTLANMDIHQTIGK